MRKAILTTIAVLLIGGPAVAQNVICPTAAPGTSNNQCASTAFVTKSVPLTGGLLGTILQGKGIGVPTAFTTATYPAITTINQILYSSSANTIVGLPVVNGGMLQTLSAGQPQWTQNPNVGGVGIGTGSFNISGTISGQAKITVNNAAGTPTLTLPNTSGTFAVNASSPLALDMTTGALTCPTCAGGGTVTAGVANQLAYYATNGNTVIGLTSPFITANSYGAVCNGSTDDHTAFQNAINAAVTAQAALRFIGNCKITTGLTIAGALDFAGVGGTQSTLTAAAGINAITVDTVAQVIVHDMGITYATTNSGDTAIVVNPASPGAGGNVASQFYNLTITGPYHGISIVTGYFQNIHDNHILWGDGYGIHVQNTTNADYGDDIITGNNLETAGGGNSLAGIYWESSGGLRVSNNKFVRTTGTALSCIEIALASGASTSDLLIENNSCELMGTYGIYLHRQGATGELSNVLIPNNQIITASECVQNPTDSNGAWLTNVSIVGNVCRILSSSATALYNILTSVDGLQISGGVVYNSGGTNNTIPVINIGGTQTTKNCTVGAYAKNENGGTSPFKADSVGGCGIITTQSSAVNASFNVDNLQPTPSTSGSSLMMGLGSSCKITPVRSSTVQITFSGGFRNDGVSSAISAAFMQLKYGTGSAPANADAETGTSFGSSVAMNNTSKTAQPDYNPVSMTAVITSLAPGTAYWFDAAVAAGNSQNVGPFNMTCSGIELPKY